MSLYDVNQKKNGKNGPNQSNVREKEILYLCNEIVSKEDEVLHGFKTIKKDFVIKKKKADQTQARSQTHRKGLQYVNKHAKNYTSQPNFSQISTTINRSRTNNNSSLLTKGGVMSRIIEPSNLVHLPRCRYILFFILKAKNFGVIETFQGPKFKGWQLLKFLVYCFNLFDQLFEVWNLFFVLVAY